MNENDYDSKEMWKARYEIAQMDKQQQFETIVQLKVAIDNMRAELQALKENDVSQAD